VLICAAIISLRIYQTPAPGNYAAQNARQAIVAPGNQESEWTLASPVATTRVIGAPPLRSSSQSTRAHRAATTPPRYVLDSVPVSYEPNLRF
jgi:hypothetical protein